MKLAVCVALIMLIGSGLADNDSDILQFAKGVAASDSLDQGLKIAIASNNSGLMGIWKMGDYDTDTPSMVNSHLGWILDSLTKVTDAYPTRFQQIGASSCLDPHEELLEPCVSLCPNDCMRHLDDHCFDVWRSMLRYMAVYQLTG